MNLVVSLLKTILSKIVFIGVNGVGKSTNLAKVGFLLMQNGLKIEN